MKLILGLFGRNPAGTLNTTFGRLQLFSSAFMALSHGSNDAQKVMGIITLSLVSGGYLTSVEVPFWVVVTCALAMGFGTALGGWKVVKTLGVSILKLEPVHGFAAETSATMVILGASHFGFPVSTTHVISSTIMGVGATRGLSAVRWGIAGKSITAWVLTLPVCGLLGYAVCKGMPLLFPSWLAIAVQGSSKTSFKGKNPGTLRIGVPASFRRYPGGFEREEVFRLLCRCYSTSCAARNMAFCRAAKNCWYGSGSSTGLVSYCAFARTSNWVSPLGRTETVILRA
jgi:hypothetical protein